MNTNTAKRIMVAGITAMAVTWFAGTAHALKAPHDYASQVNCGSYGLKKGCHSKSDFWKGMTSINTGCISTAAGCHNSDGLAKRKALSVKDASDRFGSIDPFRTSTGAKNSSHAWKVPAVNSNAGAIAVNMLSEKQWYNSVNKNKFTCTRCHRAMGDALAKGDKFLREPATGNYICFQCHSARRIDNVRDYNSSVASQTLHYSHPVEVNYSTARAAKPDFFNTTFRLATGYNESARPRLYTTHASAQGGAKKGAVVCQSCHGPIHAADSNPYTFDSLSAYSMLGTYSSSAGNLLRTYPIVGPKASNNLCLSCHKVTSHQSFMCGRCHTPHKKAGENNRYLILENISTPYNGIRPVVFTSRSEMAARFGAGYTSTWSRLDKTNRQVSNRICQVCHMGRKYHNNYSSPGGTVSREHNPYLGNNKYSFCPNCHKHTAGFTPSGCATCHNFPPDDTNNFKHDKHTNSGVEPGQSEDSFWKTGKVTDSRSDSSYGFSCGRCHSRWELYTATSGGYQGKNHYGSPTPPSNNYTTDIGFKIKTSINSLPWNPSGVYLYNGTGRILDGAGTTKWWGAGTGAECRNLYCHGQFYNGYTSNNPQARGTQACGKCHGASNTDPPGKTNGVNYGAHPRHVGSANNQQYGSGTPNFRCNACHSLTSNYNNETTVSSKKYHVNGRVNIKFDNGSSSSFRVGNANSNYDGSAYNNYTTRKPAMSVKPAYKTCRLIYCHSMGNRLQGNYSAPNNAGQNQSSPWPNWSSSKNFTTTMSIFGYNMKTRCARCHGNTAYKGITMAMPNYTSNDPSYAIKGPKENSHRKHVIENKFRCNVCHSSTINSANNSIASTKNHVNRFYNISIISAYRDNGVGRNYSSVVKTCKSITCHAGKTTPKWGSKIGCPDCHLSNTGDNDKRIKVSNTFQSFSESAPKIYSAQWAGTGHGRSSATQYYTIPSGSNSGANKTCTDCHSASVPHNTASNPFRLYTAPGRPNRVCEGCHGTNAWVSGGANKQGIQTHASSVVQTGKFNFAIKCIDCHDPHGDNNTRFMMHSTVARPLITGTRAESSNQYGQRQTNVTSSNVDFVNNQYTSDYAKKIKSPKICQVCHTRTVDRDINSPTYLGGRFRWYSASDKTHGGARCTACHSHASGFKGAGCYGCHGFPPINVQTILSGAGRTLADLANRQRPSGNNGSELATAGAHQKHYGNFSSEYKVQPKSLSTICSFCHQGGMYATGSPNYDIEIGFKAFTDYSGTSQKYGGQSAVRNGYYGYSGVGIPTAAYDGTMRCTVKCHGGDNWLSNNLGNYSLPRWNVSNSVRCGKCHGAKKEQGSGSWPESNRHAKHAGTGIEEYDFMCRVCHADTVMGTATTLNRANHVNGQATFKFYTGTFTGSRVWSQSKYTSGDTKVNSGFGWCKNLYCHSRGTTTSPPYDAPGAYSNYTAKWTTDFTLPPWASDPNSKCSFCHGSKKSAGGYAGITSAMPNQANQAHKKHVVDNGFKCNVCHSATVNSNNGIISVANHVNKFKNISIISAYRTGQTMYSSTVSAKKTCKNIRCHAGRQTPNWTSSYDSIKCTDCHYQSSGAASAEDNFAWTNFSGTAAKIYSTEWADHGHGRARPGRYPFSNRTGAGKYCYDCHSPIIKHGDANYFRIRTTGSNVAADPDKLCLRCHGSTGQLAPSGFSRITGIKTHSWANISTAGYKTGNKDGKAGWNFGQDQRAKCVDCHDPHGDRKNNYMIHSYVNMSGSDSVGRPAYLVTGTQMIFTAVGGPQVNWSSYVRSDFSGLCQRCHSPEVANFDKAQYGDPTGSHNNGQRCVVCHKHKGGFAPSGCDSCHGDSTRLMGRANWSPPKGPNATPQWSDSLTNRSSLHQPHAYNPRKRAGFGNQTGFECQRCHDDSLPAGNHNSSKTGANLNNLTSLTGWQGASRLSKVNYGANNRAPADDTCWNTKCHTPRSYTRQWRKPGDCDDCHGYTKGKGAANRVFNLQTTGSHKIHINWTGTTNLPASWKKNYKLACSNCHYDWPTTQNYSTHYNSFVNITADGLVNNIANMKVKDGQFYTRGRSFKGFTTGNESLGTCAKAYCHGNFANGTTATMPNWKKGVSTVTCISCHKGRLTFGNGSTMPERHQKHVKTNQYGFACVRCHVRTTNNITTIIFNDYSSHVNGRKDVYFNNQGGIDNTVGYFNPVVSSRQCSNTYCHSKGYRSTGSSFTTRTTLANYTADWDVTAEGRAGTNKGCSFCHGNKIYNGITAAMPNQTSLWGNSHRTHVIGNKFRCVNCHAATVNSAGTVNYAGGRHVDGFKTITIIAMYKSGATNYGAGKTCDNVKCHAGKTTPKWGTYATCKNCHFVATGSDTDDYANFRSFTGTAAKIYSTEWATKGHGSVGQNIQCTNCHKATAPHDGKDGSGNMRNPYRLFTSESIALCQGCHGNVTEREASWNIAATNTNYKTHTKTATGGNAAWNTHTSAQGRGVKCVDCHDPHGDKNRKMIHAYINHSGSDRFGRPKGRPWTDGADTNAVAMMTFTAWGGQLQWSSFATGNLSQSICRRCHTSFTQDTGMGDQPASPAPGNMTKGNYAADHQSHGAKCTSCHTHANGFKGGACNGCHGFPPTGTFNLISATPTRNEIKMPSSNSVTAGAHGRHTTVLLPGTTGGNDLKAVCSYCHSGGMADSSNDDGRISLKFKAFGYYTGPLQKYEGQLAVRNGYYSYSGQGEGTANTLRCNSMKCHGGNWLTSNLGNYTAPKWDDKNTVKCGRCHGAKRSSTVGSWPTTKAHELHAGTGTRQQNLMCRTCHGITVLGTATTLSKANHVNAKVFVELTSAGGEARVGGDSAYTGNDTVNAGFGQCDNVYCHSTGTDRVAPYGELPNFAATWTTIRGPYKKANGQLAKCNFCHGNSMSGVTSAMPNYPNDNPKANKHPKHVLEYNFLCNSCHNSVVANNTSIQGGNYSLHVNRSYNVNFNDLPGGRDIQNAQFGKYTSIGSRCESTYCHGRGVDLVAPFNTRTTLANYTAKWGDNRGGIDFAGMAKCNYCHGVKGSGGSANAAPAYANNTPKANRHPMHVTTYGFTCTVCHTRVTANNTSIDASGGRDRHVNKTYNIDFSKTAPFANNTGTYVYSATSPGSKCKNTYCHSRGTDLVKPYNTRTSFANWTARWGDTRGNGSYKQANGLKAKCNYCHGNRLFSGMTSAMPNYTSATTNTAKWNTHPIHVRGYGFACTICHVKVTANNTSIDAAGGTALHVNNAYNVNFKANVRGSLTNNTGVYVGSGTDLTVKNKCKNTYCHSRGTDFTKPYNTRTSFANWTARWGDTRGNGGYKQGAGQKAKCNYCHGNRRYSGMTSAMPNYSGNYSGTPAGVTAKANSHKMHVVDNGFVCSTCHYGVVQNNTSISDRTSHVNGFYNISITPTQKSAAGKAYSTNWTNRNAGGTCMNNKCHGTSKPKWGDPSTANCKACHFSGTADKDNYARNDGVKAEIYSSEWRKKGHGLFKEFTSISSNRCERCHKPAVGHKTASNPFRLMTSVPDKLCAGCHGSVTERNASWGVGINATNVDYKTHSQANAGKDAAWNTHSSVTGKGPKCIDCHDPHGDKNRKMIHSYINHSGSDKFGRPKGRQWTEDGQIGYSTAAMMTFTSWNYGALLGWSSFANGDANRSICRRCHTPVTQDTGMGNDPASSPGNMTKANYAGTHQIHQKCTNCHDHKAGFKGGGESTGSMSCDGCHGSGGNPDLSPMLNGQTRSYHHVMQNTSALGAGKYPTTRNLTTVGDSRRRCLMCHADHNVFRPDMNGGDSRGRAANLRANIFTKPTSNVASTRNNSDWSGTDPYGGICLSCHTIAQRKNVAKQYNDGSKFTLRILTSQFRNSPHNYTAIGVINTDGSKFKANCLKCHNDTTPKVKFKSNSGFSAHDSKLRRLNSQLGLTIYDGPIGAYLNTTRIRAANNPSWTNNQWAGRVVTIKPTTAGTGREQTRIILTNTTSGLTVSKVWKGTPATSDYLTIGDPPEEDYCFNCHSPYSNPNYSQSKDYYGMVTFVNKKALKMEMVFRGEADFATGGVKGPPATLIDTSADTVWGTDQWKDFSVKIIGGVNAGQGGVIISNSANTLYVNTTWKKLPDATTEYAIGNPYKHRIENFGGVHQSDEMVRAPGGVTTFGWFTALGQGYKPHVGCTDCHNPHAQRKPGVDRGITDKTTLTTTTTLNITPSKNWRPGEFRGLLAVAIDRSNAGEERMIVDNSATRLRVGVPFSARMTGVYITVYPKGRAFVAVSTATGAGNMLSGPNNGQWGVKVASWRKPRPSTTTAGFDNISAPVMSKMTTLTSGKDRVYNLCFKCHSRYAWGTSGKPFNIQNAFTTAGTTMMFREGRSADIASRFNPNNLAHHAVIRPGNNQPIVPNYGMTNVSSYYNNNWPAWRPAGANSQIRMDGTGKARVTASSGGLPTTVIPGWYAYVGSNIPNGRTDGKAQAGTASKGWFQISEITNYTSFKVTPAATLSNVTSFAISAGFGNNFVPPIGPWSVIACTDCHDTSSASDPGGPHGSGFRWILRGLEPQTFPWFNGTNVIKVAYSNQGWVSTSAAKAVCLNCHRADVYGFGGNMPVATTTSGGTGTLPSTTEDPGNWSNFAFRGHFSRQPHPVDAGAGTASRGADPDVHLLTVFSLTCTICHAGREIGEIHGTNMGASLDDNGALVGANTASYRGKRFLTGGDWTGVKRGNTTTAGLCWTKASTSVVPDAIAACNDGGNVGAAMRTAATYDYDAGTDY